VLDPARGERAEFVWRMEDVLELYTGPYDDPLRPQVCMEEASKQLLRVTREPLPMEPGKPERRDDYESMSTSGVGW
jgi:hypothetical protein